MPDGHQWMVVSGMVTMRDGAQHALRQAVPHAN
jgi:hypothetical protein